jgi:hypothetical protein
MNINAMTTVGCCFLFYIDQLRILGYFAYHMVKLVIKFSILF